MKTYNFFNYKVFNKFVEYYVKINPNSTFKLYKNQGESVVTYFTLNNGEKIIELRGNKEVKELLDKGYQINSGLKFGTHYRVYDYESNHAPWLIHVIKEGINWLDIARMVRVGHGVNKTIVLAYKQKWLSIEWIKP